MNPYPDEPTWWAAFEAAEAALFTRASRVLDWQAFRYAARTGRDIGAGLDKEAAAAHHLAECAFELHLGPAPRPLPVPGPPYPDEPTWWGAVEAEAEALYGTPTAGRPHGTPLDWAAFRWFARTGYSIGVGIQPATAWAQHKYELTVALGITPPVPVPIARGPLPPFDLDATDPDTGAPLPVNKTINGTIPPFSDPMYHRANLWGVTVPGLPPIVGGAGGAAQQRLLTYLIDRYPADWQATALRTYAQRGYRQFWLSIPDSRDGTKLTLGQYCDLTKRVQDVGLIPCHFLRSKDYDGRNPNPAIVEPWVDALAAMGGIPVACQAWEASIFYDPATYRATIDHDARRWPATQWGVHLQQGYADFGPDGEGHGPAFWQANLAVGVKLLLYQYKTDPKWSAGMMQARGNDVSVRLIKGGLWGLRETVDWIGFEVVAQLQFNNDTDGDGRLATEDIGDLKGLETLCTPGPLAPRGFGNGARYTDGSII